MFYYPEEDEINLYETMTYEYQSSVHFFHIPNVLIEDTEVYKKSPPTKTCTSTLRKIIHVNTN